MKNQVTKADFLKWYLNGSDTYEFLGSLAFDLLMEKGSATITTEQLFEDCGYIPAYICIGQEDADSEKEYDTENVELI